MLSGNNIHVQQHNTNMINEEWNKTQNDAPFVPFYNMCAVTFVLPDEMADVSIAGLQWLILIPRLNHTGYHRPTDSHSIPYLHRETRAANCRNIRPSYPKVLWQNSIIKNNKGQ